ncbi:MAG: zinc ribbon domain-containing protein [Roseburia sp.]|uniref:zinc ribbon domain-containing protein n=1 Tax=Roseburia hominis TaxID=301301 RepID=UPI001F3EA456|nr:hypothetical protein [Roseburia hominis]MCI5713342.1 zinc ribbon domain-containing protein [Lachnospiraceae bacterium]
MESYILYIIMGIIGFFIAFLVLRIILQMIFIKQCPQCNKTVSLAKSHICPRCGYDFHANRDPKFRLTVTFLVIAILGIGAFDVYSFIQKSEAYEMANPYINVGSITRDDSEITSTEEATEQPATEQQVTEQAVPEQPAAEQPEAEQPAAEAEPNPM